MTISKRLITLISGLFSAGRWYPCADHKEERPSLITQSTESVARSRAGGESSMSYFMGGALMARCTGSFKGSLGRDLGHRNDAHERRGVPRACRRREWSMILTTVAELSLGQRAFERQKITFLTTYIHTTITHYTSALHLRASPNP